MITVVAAVLIDRIYKYRQQTPPEQLRGNAWNLLFSLPLLLCFHFGIIFIDSAKGFIDSKLAGKIAARLCDKRFVSVEKREERSHLLAKWVFDVAYYFSTSVAMKLNAGGGSVAGSRSRELPRHPQRKLALS